MENKIQRIQNLKVYLDGKLNHHVQHISLQTDLATGTVTGVVETSNRSNRSFAQTHIERINVELETWNRNIVRLVTSEKGALSPTMDVPAEDAEGLSEALNEGI